MPSMLEQWESGHWVANAQDNAMIVIGVASRDIRRENEIYAAKTDAAMKVAMYYGFKVNTEYFERISNDIFDNIFDSRSSFEHVVQYEQFIDKLTFDPVNDVIIHDRGTIVRFSFPEIVVPVIFTGIINNNGRPNWLNNRNLPDINGYMIAAGFSMKQEWLRDTVMRSAANAAARLMGNMSTSIENIIIDVVGLAAISYIYTTSEGVLYDFRVLEFWIDPENGDVYTLAIARYL